MPWAKTDLKRSYECNELLTTFRLKRGWTQSKLAQETGYSERLVRKAEMGRSVSTDAIADLADALSLPDDPLLPEDLISDIVHLARVFVEAWYVQQKHAVDRIRYFLDDDIAFDFAGEDAEGVPFAGKYRGPDQLAEFFASFFSYCEVPDQFDHTPFYSFHADGNAVSVVGQSWIHPIGHPLDQPIDTHLLMEFRAGKLFRVRDLFDTQRGSDAIKNALGTDSEPE